MDTVPMFEGYQVGYDIPALPGMPESAIQTPCLVVDHDAFFRNLDVLRRFCASHQVRLRPHAKTHRSVDIALHQIQTGGACGVCCQKVSEAEVLAHGGVKDILVSNEVRDPLKLDRLARIPKLGTRIIVCADDPENVDELSEAAQHNGTTIEVLVEIDCGAGRCGATPGREAADLAALIARAPGLVFAGLQAYQGSAQHKKTFEERKSLLDSAVRMVSSTVTELEHRGLRCDIIGGGGTGTYPLEAASGVFNELQCGSYIFMDADYNRVLDPGGKPMGAFDNALFILTSVMSHVKNDRAIVDAGLKVQSVDSGMPVVSGRTDVEYLKCSDEHGVVADPACALKVGDKLRLIPGHCDPTCNVHDWYVVVRNGMVETLWPVSARGRSY
jgi:3-hydroxy-D-aspartate aldolase